MEQNTTAPSSSKFDQAAKNAAKQIISDNLVAPATAKWNDFQIVEKDNYNRYIVRVNVDAQNSFGVLIRNYYLVLLTITDSDHFSYSKQNGIGELNRDTQREKEVLASLKIMNNWDQPQ